MATSYANARALLAPHVDNGVLATDTARIDAKIDEAQRRLIQHYNFVGRREESSKAPLTWQAGGTSGNFIYDDIDATKCMILSLWREENNDLERAATLEQKAYSYVERRVIAEVEQQRRSEAETLQSSFGINTLGGLRGRLMLETMNRYKMPAARVDSYINQALQQAVDQHNFVARTENYDQAQLTFNSLSSNSASFPTLLTAEVIRLLVVSLMVTDSGADGTGLKAQAFEIIQRNVVSAVEVSRKNVAGDVGRLHNELPGGTTIPTARLQRYLTQATEDAEAQWRFYTRREEYENAPVPQSMPFEITKKYVESYMATAAGQAETSQLLKTEASSLVERQVTTAAEQARRTFTGDTDVARLHNELSDGLKFPSSRLSTLLGQAQTDASSHYDFLARREGYAGETKPNPFPFEIRKKLVESYLATAKGATTAGAERVVDFSAALKTEALALVERNLMQQVEASRRAQAGLTGKLHNELPEGYLIPTARLAAYAAQAEDEADAHFAFLARRENYKGTPPAWSYEIIKKLVESYLATAASAVEVATKTKEEAFVFIERDLMAVVETARRDLTTEAGHLHNELPDGATIPTARLERYLTQAAADALAHFLFVARREDYTSTAPAPFSFEVRKKLVEAYLHTAKGDKDSAEYASNCKREAFDLIERDVQAAVEAVRRDVAGKPDETKLHNELPDGVKIPTARLTAYLSQAVTEAGAHWDFLARRENYLGTKPNPFSFEVRKKLVESYLATAQAAPDVATKLKQEAFEFIDRDLMQQVEASRRSVPDLEGKLHNELPDGVAIPTARLTAHLASANTEATAHWNFLARREDYKATAPGTFDDEIRKKLVESYVATSRGQADVAAAFKQEAFALVERNLVRSVEEARRDTTGEIGRLHNEIAGGLQIPTSRMQTLADQAVTEIRAHQAFLQRREDYSGSRPPVSYEQKKLMIESYLVPAAMTRKNNSPTGSVVVVNGRDEDSKYADAAGAIKASALALVERDVIAMIEDDRRARRQQLAASSSDTFGHHWGRAGLELPEAYRISDAAIKRLINTAEEQLMQTGKWVGTVETYTLNVTATGEFFLPQEIETILFMSFDNNPRAVHDRYSEWLRGGPGYRGADYTWMQGAVDRGEAPDPADGNKLKRKYFITLPDTVPVVRILGKRRFLPHASDNEKMYLRNFAAVFEAAKGFLLGGDQIAAHMEKATQMLATQIAQQNFTGQPPIRRAVRFMR